MIIIFKKPFIYLTISIILVSVIVLSVLLAPSRELPAPIKPLPSPSSLGQNLTIAAKPVEMEQVPVKSTGEGGGVDTSSEIIKNSEQEISEMSALIPFQTDLTLSTGVNVTILIPAKELQINPWTLTVQIFGINYQLTESDPKYEINKKSFLEASSQVFGLIKTANADPDMIIISWGDRAFIQESAQKWLNSQ